MLLHGDGDRLMNDFSKKAKEDRARRHVWLGASGEETPYKEMSDTHLMNVLFHLRKRALLERELVIYDLATHNFGGDGACDLAESAMADFLDEENGAFAEFMGAERDKPLIEWEWYAAPAFEGLKAEAERRKLDLRPLNKGVREALQDIRQEGKS